MGLSRAVFKCSTSSWWHAYAYELCWCSVWKHALHSALPLIDPLNNGFIRDTSTKYLLPRSLPEDIPIAPENILKQIRCSCESDTPCKTMRCRCAGAKLPCTVFCNCHADDCYNKLTKSVVGDENTSDEIDI